MLTPATRGRTAKIEKKTKRSPSDLTDEEWARIQPFLPGASKTGRSIEVDLREILNAIRYMAHSGGGWRMLATDFPPWQTVYWWFRRFVRRFMFQTIHDVALMLDREQAGREASPAGGVVDSRSVKATEAKTSICVFSQAWIGFQGRSSLMRTLARTTSFRMIAVMATLAFLPALRRRL